MAVAGFENWAPDTGFGSDTFKQALEKAAAAAGMSVADFQKSPEVYYAPGLSTVLTARGSMYYSAFTNEVIGPFA